MCQVRKRKRAKYGNNNAFIIVIKKNKLLMEAYCPRIIDIILQDELDAMGDVILEGA